MPCTGAARPRAGQQAGHGEARAETPEPIGWETTTARLLPRYLAGLTDENWASTAPEPPDGSRIIAVGCRAAGRTMAPGDAAR
jgi:hypothetical protein